MQSQNNDLNVQNDFKKISPTHPNKSNHMPPWVVFVSIGMATIAITLGVLLFLNFKNDKNVDTVSDNANSNINNTNTITDTNTTGDMISVTTTPTESSIAISTLASEVEIDCTGVTSNNINFTKNGFNLFVPSNWENILTETNNQEYGSENNLITRERAYMSFRETGFDEYVNYIGIILERYSMLPNETFEEFFQQMRNGYNGFALNSEIKYDIKDDTEFAITVDKATEYTQFDNDLVRLLIHPKDSEYVYSISDFEEYKDFDTESFKQLFCSIVIE